MKNDEVVLVFRPPENPAAQVAGITPFKGLRVKLDELLDWFKGLNVDSIELWIEGAWKTENRTEVFLSLEGKTCAKVTLKPIPKNKHAKLVPETVEAIPTSNLLKTDAITSVITSQGPPERSSEKVETASETNLLETKPNSSIAAGQNPEATPLGLPQTKASPVPEKTETASTTTAASATSASTLTTETSSGTVANQDPPQANPSGLPKNQTTPKPQRVRLAIKRFLRLP